ncbi:unnamed protein product [Adineta steineri]|uniref:Uncharacterized protein n=1 Tax=Adineta steineri TaxID=433720 RepID=A0A813YX60_9BILA|nr:unnamed protein product [Adineta steineri]
MSSTMLFIVLLVITVARAAPVQDETCDVQAYRQSHCTASVFVQHGCTSATVDLIHTDFLQSCSSVRLNWAYAANNLTLIIGRQEHQAFTVTINNDQLIETVSHIYRIIGNQETEVTTKDHKLVQKSDSNGQIKLKLEVPPELMPYVVFVNYDID